MREQLSKEAHIRLEREFNEAFGLDVTLPRLNKGDGSYDTVLLEALKTEGKLSKGKASKLLGMWQDSRG